MDNTSIDQQYPPGTQKNYNSFSPRNPITVKGKELEYPEGAGGGKGYRGHEVASTLRREAPLREPGVPPSIDKTPKQHFIENIQKWYQIEDKLKIVNENTRKLRDMKSDLSKSISEYMQENNLAEKKISIKNGEIRLVDKKEYTPLSFTYVELCLDNIISDPEQVKFIMNYIREQRDITVTKELRYYEK